MTDSAYQEKDGGWTQQHRCKICGAEWECMFTMCWEPFETECGKCRCGPMKEICGWKEPLTLSS